MINGHLVESLPAADSLRVVKADMNALKAHWPWLRDKLLLIKRNTEYPKLRDRLPWKERGEMAVRGRIRWIPEQIRFAIMQGIFGKNSVELFFFVGPDFEGRDDEIKAFVITTCDSDPFLHVPVDFIGWLGWSKYPHLMEQVDVRLEDLARERGCTGIEHTTAREGWGRRTARWGYKKKWTIWRKELD